MATFFYFLGQLFSGQLFELFARETNLKKQSSVLLSKASWAKSAMQSNNKISVFAKNLR